MKKIFTILSLISVAALTNAQNLVQNPGFESGLAPWAAGTVTSYTAPMISTTEFHSGAQSAGYEVASATTGFYQNVTISPSTEYVLSFWYKASSQRDPLSTSYGNIFRVWSINKDSAGAAVYTSETSNDDPLRTNNGYLPLSEEWVQHSVPFTSHANAASIDVAFRVYGNGTAFVDDVELVAANLAVVDVKEFDRQVKMNTLVGDQLTLRLPEKSTVNIYSIDGKLVSSNRVSDGGSVNTAGLQKGNYIVTVDNGTAKISRKVIKK